jgi:hypothetical protein
VKTPAGFLALVAAGALLPACSTKMKPYECAALERRQVVHAREIWDCHRDIVARAIEGKDFTLREFRRATEFFGTLTGIPAHTRPGPYGPLPGPDLASDLRRWDEWLEANERRMYWDPVRKAILMLPPSPGGEE